MSNVVVLKEWARHQSWVDNSITNNISWKGYSCKGRYLRLAKIRGEGVQCSCDWKSDDYSHMLVGCYCLLRLMCMPSTILGYFFNILIKELSSHSTKRITTDICIEEIWVLSLKYLRRGVVFLLASWVFYSDNYFDIIDLPETDRVETAPAEIIRLLSNLQIRSTLSYHGGCIVSA